MTEMSWEEAMDRMDDAVRSGQDPLPWIEWIEETFGED